MRTEDELSGALRDAADRAPELDLLAGVGARRRRRIRRRAQLLAAAAVAAVAGVVSTSTVVAQGAFSSGGGDEMAVKPTSVAITTVTPSPLPAKTSRPHPGPTVTRTVTPTPLVEGTPVRKLWPKAVFQMPAKNADGWLYRPITSIGATEVLLKAEPLPGKAGKLEVYDAKTGKSRVVTEIPVTPGLKQNFQGAISTDGTNVVWYNNARKDGTWIAELWWAPLPGGKAKLAVTLTGADADVDAIGSDGENIVWSTKKGGVYRVPFAGGTPARVPKGDGLHLIDWPWAGDAGNVFLGAGRNQSKIVNLADGTVTKIAIKDKTKDLRCGPVWCLGRRGGTAFVQRLDGTRAGKVPGAKSLGGPNPYPLLDRFAVSALAVYDINTGRVASVLEPGSVIGISILSRPSKTVYWRGPGNPDKYWVLNLAAVPPAQ
ncbi:hypothetical protein AB0L53_09475 [Nonomuraea sp. NPDC052129]|uniref:hypothetical protein n=1 Tax=Nonomuraea sp. NPDC052129 TaxID=3154651 RepID=UPI00342DE8E2